MSVIVILLGAILVKEATSNTLKSKFIAEHFSSQNICLVDIIMCNDEDAFSYYTFLKDKHYRILSFISSQRKKYDFISQFTRENWNNRIGIFYDFSCESSKYLSLKHIQENIYPDPSVLLWSNTFENISQLFINRKWGKKYSDVFIAVPNINDEINLYKMISSLKRKSKLETIIHEQEISMFQKNIDMTGLTLRGAVNVIDIPLNDRAMEDPENLKNISPLTDFTINIHGYLRNLYGFEWDLITTDNDILKNDSYQFKESINELDFIITTEKLGKDTFKESTSLQPIKYVRQCYLFLHPPIFTFPAFYTRPLSVDLWIGLAVLLIGSALLYYIVCCFDIEDIDYNERSFSGCFLVPLGILANQGLNVLADRTSKRVIQFTLLEFDIIVWCFYSAVILNYLLYPTFVILQSTEDLEYEGFTFGKENIPFNNVTSVEKADKLNVEINKLIESSKTLDLIDGVETMMSSKFAFYTIESNVYKIAPELFRKDEICSLVSIPLHKVYGISMYLKNHLKVKDYFQRGLMLIREFGIIDREDKVFNKINLKCTGTSEFVEIGIHSTLFACKIYSTGVLLSLTLLIVELFCFRVLKLKLDYV